jgi:hypothetical protein
MKCIEKIKDIPTNIGQDGSKGSSINGPVLITNPSNPQSSLSSIKANANEVVLKPSNEVNLTTTRTHSSASESLKATFHPSFQSVAAPDPPLVPSSLPTYRPTIVNSKGGEIQPSIPILLKEVLTTNLPTLSHQYSDADLFWCVNSRDQYQVIRVREREQALANIY